MVHYSLKIWCKADIKLDWIPSNFSFRSLYMDLLAVTLWSLESILQVRICCTTHTLGFAKYPNYKIKNKSMAEMKDSMTADIT